MVVCLVGFDYFAIIRFNKGVQALHKVSLVLDFKLIEN